MVVKITSRPESHVAQNLMICCLLMTINGISMINVETIKFLLVSAIYNCVFSKFKCASLVQIYDLQRSGFVPLPHFWFGYSQEVNV